MQSQVDEVKDVMTQNIEKVLQRGDRLEDLMEKTDDLEASVSIAKTVHYRINKMSILKEDVFIPFLFCYSCSLKAVLTVVCRKGNLEVIVYKKG